jgi:hypothetical protein
VGATDRFAGVDILDPAIRQIWQPVGPGRNDPNKPHETSTAHDRILLHWPVAEVQRNDEARRRYPMSVKLHRRFQSIVQVAQAMHCGQPTDVK